MRKKTKINKEEQSKKNRYGHLFKKTRAIIKINRPNKDKNI